MKYTSLNKRWILYCAKIYKIKIYKIISCCEKYLLNSMTTSMFNDYIKSWP